MQKKPLTTKDHLQIACNHGLKDAGQMIADFADRQAARKRVKAELSKLPAHRHAAATYRDILAHLKAADSALAAAKDLAYFDFAFWHAANRHASRIAKQLSAML